MYSPGLLPTNARTLLIIVIALAAIIAALAGPRGALANHTSAIISNGVVQLGVWGEGHLNVPGGTPSSETGTTEVGLRYVPTNAEATAPGCLCEGWGVADATTLVTGSANEDFGIVNVTPVSFASDASSAVSVVDVGTTFRVTHNFHPALATPNLYQVDVTIENISGAPLNDVRYRRVMDWDVEPTAFDEFVTIETGTSSALLFSSDDGFASGDPLVGPSSILFTGEAVDSGPDDHGALFDFGFGALAAGASHGFRIYYGAGSTEAEALAAVTAVGAEVFSFGQPSTTEGPTLGTPNTFIFGFSGVGGAPVFTPTPTPSPTPGPATPTPTPTLGPATPTPTAAPLPNTSAGGQGGDAAALAVLFVASLSMVAWRNRAMVWRRRAH